MFVYSFKLVPLVLIVLSLFCYYIPFPLIDVRCRVALLGASGTEGIPVSPQKKKGEGKETPHPVTKRYS